MFVFPSPAMKRRWIVWLAASIGALVLALVLDHAIYMQFYYEHIYDNDLGRMLRTFGFLPFWWLCAAALALTDARMRRNAALLAVAPTLTGLVGEVAKLLIRRERPMAHQGQYVFRSWSEHTF